MNDELSIVMPESITASRVPSADWTVTALVKLSPLTVNPE